MNLVSVAKGLPFKGIDLFSRSLGQSIGFSRFQFFSTEKTVTSERGDYLLDDDINGDPSNPLNKPMHFGSFQKQRQPNSFRRLPICFPDIKLTLMKLEEHQLEQIKQTGWLREAAFKTTPNTTKLEIKAFLESVYGMEVERVNTANYLGRKRVVYTGKAKELYREDDYKKAYVIFKKPEGLSLPETEPEPVDDRPLLQKLVDIKLKRK